MKKTMIVLFFALFIGMGGTEVKANVFASSVTVDFNGTFPATISYNLNQAATSVVITIKDNSDGTVVQTITIASGENGAFVGFNDVEWDGSLAAGGTASSGIFTIEIDASDSVGSDGFELISFETGPDSWYWSSSGVASNNRQTNPYFGTIYVTERTGGTSSNAGGIRTDRGLYQHDSFGRYLGSQQSIAYAAGNSVIAWEDFGGYEGSPFGATVGPDGRVYVWVLASNAGAPYVKDGGLSVGDGEWSTSSVETILDHTDLSNHGAISDAIVVGTGANRMLYTVEQDTSGRTGSDNDKVDDGDGFDSAQIKSYALGESTGPFTGAGTVVIPTSTLSHPFRIEMDSAGYLYVVQQVYDVLAVANTIYGLSKWDISGTPTEMWHVNLDAAPPNDSTANANNAQATRFNGLALDELKGRVYVTRKSTARPLHNVIGYAMDTGAFWKSFASAESVVGGVVSDITTGGGSGSSIRDVNVDAAGNLLVVNSSFEALRIFSPPDGANNFNTYSPWAIDVDNSVVIPTPIDFSTSVDENISSVPARFSLAQNYPNPFNAGTVIKYSLVNSGEVSLVIHDLLGREVVSLVKGRQSAGTHTVQWFGQDNKGQDVASGIYFYKLTLRSSDGTGSPVNLTKRLLYLK